MNMQTARFFTIPSETIKGKKYTVRHLPTGEWKCECPQSIFRNSECKHIKKAQEKAKN